MQKWKYSKNAQFVIKIIEHKCKVTWNNKEALHNITELHLNENEISDLTPLNELYNLKKLSLKINSINNFNFFDKLHNLIELDLSNNSLTDIYFLDKLSKLSKLYLSYNQITDISFLNNLTNLTHLNLTNNQVEYAYVSDNLKNLKILSLSNNRIKDVYIPKELTKLHEIYLGNNQITDIFIPKELKKLFILDLRKNLITNISIPKELTKLREIYLGNNQITDISISKEITNLNRLDLQNNRLKKISNELANLNLEIKMKYNYISGLLLDNNPIIEPPLEIIAQGNKAIREYFASLEEGQEKINELKVLIVGHGESGKTSLLKRILGREFDPHEHQTYGIEIHQKQIEYIDREIKANFWDFGGQKIMHSTHQFFFTERSFYLLVLDGRAEEDAEYWLKHIESFGGDSPIIVLLNKIDQNPSFDVDRKHLKDKYNIKGFYPISCETTEGLEVFIEGLHQEILKVDSIEIKWSPKWLKVKEYLEQSAQHYITHERFEEICVDEQIEGKERQKTLMGFLHDLGVALNFKKLEYLSTFVLNPIWVTEAVYKIINDKEVIENKGSFTEEILQRILFEDKFPDHKLLFIVKVMQQFEVCYQADEENYLIPSLFSIREPEIEFDTSNALVFQIGYNFLPNSIISKFIVHRHSEIKDDLRWRTGVILEDKTLKVSAYIKADLKEKIVYIKVNGVQKREYLSEIRKSFRNIHATYKHLTIEEFLMYDGHLFDYNTLIESEYYGDKTIRKGAKRYIVREILSGIEEPQETQANIINVYGDNHGVASAGNGNDISQQP